MSLRRDKGKVVVYITIYNLYLGPKNNLRELDFFDSEVLYSNWRTRRVDLENRSPERQKCLRQFLEIIECPNLGEIFCRWNVQIWTFNNLKKIASCTFDAPDSDFRDLLDEFFNLNIKNSKSEKNKILATYFSAPYI